MLPFSISFLVRKIFLLLLLFLGNNLYAQDIIYVKQNTLDGNDGSSWANAYDDLQSAIAGANAGDIIWVAKGTYYPSTTDNTISFNIPDGIEMYGGFVGEEANTYDLATRDFLVNETQLSGNDFSEHVVKTSSVSSATIIDGFTITKASGSFELGGGWYNENSSSPSIKNCIFKENFALAQGGAMYNNNSNPTLLHCSFIENQVLDNGGAIYNTTNSNPTIMNCSFINNHVISDGNGGAIYNEDSNPILFNCTFSGNSTSGQGGAMANLNNSSPQIVNCTFNGNTSNNDGGAIYNQDGSNPQIFNTIIWGNQANNRIGTPSASVYDNPLGTSNTPIYSYSLVQSITNNTNNNIDGNTDPIFISPVIFGSTDLTNVNLRLTSCSPLLNKGNNLVLALLPTSINTTNDLAGNPRIFNTATIDLGAYEYQGAPLTAMDTILYVKADATGYNTGANWENAFTDLQDALSLLDFCSNPDESSIFKQIWVAKGTYYPTTGTDRTISFDIPDGIEIYGGFDGEESATYDLSARAIQTNQTILSGNIGDPAIDTDNSMSVVQTIRVSNATIIDGFSITKGYGEGGGGWYNAGVQLQAVTGIATNSFNSDFIASNPVIKNCRFIDNAANNGGAMLNEIFANPTLINCIFTGNLSRVNGGALYNLNSSSPQLINCVFSGNKARIGGAMYNNNSSAASITNCTFSGNTAVAGGAMFNFESNPKIYNTIIWGNEDGGGVGSATSSINSFNAVPTYSYSLIQGITNNTNGNLDGNNPANNPNFIEPIDITTVPTIMGDLRLNQFSLAIGSGNNANFPNLASTQDLAGQPRKKGRNIDMGAYEFQGNDEGTLTASNGDNDAYIDVQWKLAKNICLSDGGRPFPNGAYVQLMADGQELFSHTIADLEEIDIVYDSTYRHYVGPSTSVTYTLNVYQIGDGNILCSLTADGSTKTYEGIQFSATENLYDAVELEWQSNSALPDKFNIYRANDFLVSIENTQVIGSIYTFRDTFTETNPNSIVNGTPYEYCIEIFSNKLNQAFPRECDNGKTTAIGLTASKGTSPTIITLDWNQAIATSANMLQVLINGTVSRTLPASQIPPYELAGSDVIPGDTLIIGLRLLDNNQNLLATDYDKGYIPPNGIITGKVSTKTGGFPIQGATIIASTFVNGLTIIDSTLSQANGTYEIDSLFYNFSNTFTVSIKKKNQTFVLPSQSIVLNLDNPEGILDFKQIESYPEGTASLTIESINYDSLDGQSALQFDIDFTSEASLTYLRVKRGTEEITTLVANNDVTPFSFKDSTGIPKKEYVYEFTLFSIIEEALNEVIKDSTIRFPQIPPASGLVATAVNNKGYIRLNWAENSSSLSGLKLFRISDTDSVQIASLDPMTIRYDDRNGFPGQYYTYQLTPYRNVDDLDYDATSMESNEIRYPILPVISNLTAFEGADTIGLTWTKAAKLTNDYNYTGFLIERSDGNNTISQMVYKDFSTAFTDFRGAPGQSYEYAVYAVKEFADTLAKSGRRSITEIFPIMSAPTGLVASDEALNYQVALEWTAPTNTKNLDGYGIFDHTDVLLKTTNIALTKDTLSVHHSSPQTYKVKAFRLINGTPIYSAETADNGSPIIPDAPANLLADIQNFHASDNYIKQVQLTWEYPEYVLAEFIILRDDIELKTIGVGERAYFDTTALSGINYNYKIYAARTMQLVEKESKRAVDNGKALANLQHISGVVTSTPNNRAINQAKIVLTATDFNLFTFTDTAGHYQFRNVPLAQLQNVTLRATATNAIINTNPQPLAYNGSRDYIVDFHNTFEPPIPDTTALAALLRLTGYPLDCEGAVRFTWTTSNNNYDGFEIRRGITTIGLVPKGAPMVYTDSLASPGVSQPYQISPYKTTDGNKQYGSGLEGSIQIPPLSPVEGLYASLTLADNEVNLFWSSPCDHITHYEIERSEEFIGEISGDAPLTFRDTTGVPGENYFYTLIAVKVRADGTYESEAREIEVTYPDIAPINNLVITSPVNPNPIEMRVGVGDYNDNYSLNHTLLQWSYNSTHCDGFSIYRDGDPLITLPCDSTQYKDYGGIPGQTPTYEVKVLLERNGIPNESDRITKDWTFPDLAMPYNFKAISDESNANIRLEFKYDTEGFDGFEIHRSGNANLTDAETFILNEYVPGGIISFQDKMGIPGSNYYYGVSAFSMRNGIKKSSAINKLPNVVGSLTYPKLPKPSILSATSRAYFNRIDINWLYNNAIPFDGFELVRKGSHESYITSIFLGRGERIHEDIFNELGDNRDFSYKIRAYKDYGGIHGMQFSDWSNTNYGSASIHQLEQETVTVRSSSNGAQQGHSVAVDGNWMVVGSPGWDNDKGKIDIYKFNGKQWILDSDFPGRENSRYGAAVDIDEGRIIVGAPNFINSNDDETGVIVMFHLKEGIWERTGDRLGYSSGSRFGESVAIKGSWVVTSSSLFGKIYLSKFNGSQYENKKEFTLPGLARGTYYGSISKMDIDLSDDYLVVNATHPNARYFSSNAYIPQTAYTSKLTDNNWGALEHLYSRPGNAVAATFLNLSIDNDLILMERASDEIIVHQLEGENWVKEESILRPSHSPLSNGSRNNTIAIKDDYAAITGDKGSVFLYKRGGNNIWNLQRTITPSDPEDANFGYSVSINDKHIIIGAPNWAIDRGKVYYYPIDPGLTAIEASQGTFSTKTRIDWTYEGNTDLIKEFKIYRDEQEIATLDASASNVFDSDGIAGKVYMYRVEVIWADGLVGLSKSSPGFSTGSGEISGTVQTIEGNVPIAGVTITAESMVDFEYYCYKTESDVDGKFTIPDIYVGAEKVDFKVTADYGNHIFIDKEQELTLRPESSVFDGLLFLDQTAIVVTGQVSQEGVSCGLENININLLNIINGEDGLDTLKEEFQTNADGRYNLVINPFQVGLKSIQIKIDTAQLSGDIPNQDTLLFNSDPPLVEFTTFEGDFPIKTEKNFVNTLTYPVTFRVQDACENPVSDDLFEIRIVSTDGCYNQIVETNAIAPFGEVTIPLPPLDYTIKVEGVNKTTVQNLIVLDYLKYKPKTLKLSAVHERRGNNSFLSAVDSLELTKKFTYHRAPTISLTNGVDFLCTENVAVFEQGNEYNLTFTVTEEHDGTNCPVKEGALRITNPGATITSTTLEIDSSGQIPPYVFEGGNPNVITPFKWTMTVDYLDDDGKFQGRIQQIMVVEGSTAIPGNDVVVQPDSNHTLKIPHFILRDPPGDGSYATISEGQVVSKSMTIAETGDKGAGFYKNLQINAVGFGKAYDGTTIFGGINGQGESFDYEVTTNRSLSTSETLTGPDADVIIGSGMALQYGMSQRVFIDGCKISAIQETAFTPYGATTEWIYTVGQLKNIIQEIKADADSIHTGQKIIKNSDGTLVTALELEVRKGNWEDILNYHRINTLPHYLLCTESRLSNPDEEGDITTQNEEIQKWQGSFCKKFGEYNLEAESFKESTIKLASGRDSTYVDFDEHKVWDDALIDHYNNANDAIRNIKQFTREDLLEGGSLESWRFAEGNLEEDSKYRDQDYEARFGIQAKNYTFGGGTTQTISISGENASTKSYTNSYYVNSELAFGIYSSLEATMEVGLGVSLGNRILSSEGGVGLKFTLNYNFTEDRSVTEKNTVEMSYTLADDDVGDQYSVTVIKGSSPNHTPYFTLLGGRTSCPVEEGAIHRDRPDIQWYNPDTKVSLGKALPAAGLIPADEPAIAYLQITNQNPFGEARDVTVFLENSSNEYGAVVRLGSILLGEDIIEDLGANQPLILPVTLERGFISYTHEDVIVSARHTCRDGTEPTLNGVSLGGQRDDITISANFRSPCSPVTIITPDPNWVIRKNISDTEAEKLTIGVRDYDLSNENFTNLTFEYRQLGGDWLKMPDPENTLIDFVVDKKALVDYNKVFGENTPTYFYIWDMNNIDYLDGDYEIRALVFCNDIGVTTYSNVVPGKIDRTNPQLFGTPQPADGLWTNGDEISVTFNKLLDCTLFGDPDFVATNFELYNHRLAAVIPATIVCGGGDRNGKLIITPTFEDGEDMSLYDGDTLELRLTNIADISGNVSEDISWKFVVLTHPLYWSPKEISLEVYQGTQTNVDAHLFSITNLPVTGTLTNTGNAAWLSAPSSVSVPNVGRTVSLGIDASILSVGTYAETLILAVEGQSDKPLTIHLKVVAEAPKWVVNHTNFSENMSMVSNFTFDGAAPIADNLDIISVWLDNEIRGVANIDETGGFNIANLFISGNGATDKDKELEFRVWVASEGKEYDAFPAAPILFEANSQVGTHTAPELLDIDKDKNEARYIPLNKDWTWFSVNTSIENDSINYWLGNLSKATTGDVIYNGERFAQYNEGIGWINEGSDSLLTLNANEGYMIHLQNGPDTLRITGANAPLEELRLKSAGWTWIGYPFRDSLALNDPAITVENIVNEENNLENGDEIKTLKQDKIGVFARYLNEQWNGSLTHLRPYDAYKLKTTKGGNLNYLGSNGINGVNGIIGVEDSLQVIASFQSTTTPNPLDASTWNRAPLNYEHLLPVIGEVFFNGVVATSPNDKLAAFVGNDLRGLGAIKMMHSVNRYEVGFLIGGVMAGEEYTLYYYNAAADKVFEVEDKLSLNLGTENGGSLGYGEFSDPHPIEIALFTTTVAKQDVFCTADKTGFIEVIPVGAFTPTYAWSHDNTATGNRVEGLAAGAYTVSITDIRNVPVIKTIEIINQSNAIEKPTVVGAADPICLGSSIALIASSPAEGAEFRWFDAAGTALGADPRLILNNRQETETIKVVALINGVCQSDFTDVPIVVSAVGSANFEVSDRNPEINNQTVTFTPITQIANYSYAWDFGDGQTATEMIAEHIYIGTGPFTVSLSLTSPDNCKASNISINVISTHEATCGISFDLDGVLPEGIHRQAENITSAGTVEVGKNVELRAGTSIVLSPGFHAKTASTFLAMIDPCTASLEQPAIPATERLSDLPASDFSVAANDLKLMPNPSHGFTKIQFQLPEASKVSLLVFNPQGKLVDQLISDKFYDQGQYEVDYSLDGLGYGVFQIVLQRDRELITKKLIILR